MRYPVTWDGHHQRQTMTSVDKEVKELEPSYTTGESVKWCSHFGRPPSGSSKVKHTITPWLSHSTLGCIPKRNENMCSCQSFTWKLTAALFIAAKKEKETESPSADEWVNTMWYVYAREYCLTIRRNELRTQAMTWINLENVMLSERSQTQRITYCVITFLWNGQKRQLHKDRKQIRACQSLGGGNGGRTGGMMAKQYRVSF